MISALFPPKGTKKKDQTFKVTALDLTFCNKQETTMKKLHGCHLYPQHLYREN